MTNPFQKRYNQIWKHTAVQEPSIWSSWEIVKNFAGKKCLEIGCGNYPKIPLENGFFLELNEIAVSNLKNRGLNAYLGSAENLPFKDNFFDLVVAWDVLEHVVDDKKAFSEISRVLKRDGYFLFSVPLRKDKFSKLDKVVGHKRRYETEELEEILKKNDLKILKFRCPSLFKYLDKVMPFLGKIYSQPKHVSYFNLPKPFVNLLVRFFALLGRIFSGPWKAGSPKEVKEEININIFCIKSGANLKPG